MATFADQLKQQAEQVNNMYDANRETQLRNLENAYNQNLSDRQASMNQINPAYQNRANDLAVQYERNRRNFNQQAAGNGVNTGVASQAALAQNSAYQRDYGNLRVAQQNALNEAQRDIDNLTSTYQNNVQAAIAQNDYERASALLNQYKNDYQNQLTLAANLAKYGDFSGYNGIYDSAQVANMRKNWIASNPDLAYRTGNITAAQYRNYTGNYPAGYTPAGGSGGSDGGRWRNIGDGAGLTTEQIKNLQTAMGVTPDGLWGKQTQTAYDAYKNANQNNNAARQATRAASTRYNTEY